MGGELIGLGALALAFLLTVAMIRLALALADYIDRRNGHSS